MASVRKLACSVKFTYKTGLQAETLQGTDFTLDQGIARVRLGFDLGSNLQGRNRGLMCHAEALEFIDSHEDLQSIEIQERQLILALGNVPPDFFWHVDVKCRPDLVYQYLARPKVSKDAVLLTIERMAEGSR